MYLWPVIYIYESLGILGLNYSRVEPLKKKYLMVQAFFEKQMLDEDRYLTWNVEGFLLQNT